MSSLQGEEWNRAIADLPGAHILQTWQWGQFKSTVGWQPIPQVWRDGQGKVRAAALVLRRSAPGGLSVLYVPRGPLVDWSDQEWVQKVLVDLQELSRRQRAIFIKMDPELIVASGIPGTESDQVSAHGAQAIRVLETLGWRPSQEQIQFRNTAWLDLTGTEDDWLARMKQKARYNLRLSQRKGVNVRIGTVEDLSLMYRMYAETSVRDGFVIRSEQYYTSLWRFFIEQGLAEPLIASVEGEPVAAIMVFMFAGRAWYLYGMSRQVHREKMPNYLVQWEAMRLARAHGCTLYDLWGAPDVFNEFDSMWGVFRFKEGLGAEVIRTSGAWDYSPFPLMHTLYSRVLPRILDVMRRRRKESTRQEVSL